MKPYIRKQSISDILRMFRDTFTEIMGWKPDQPFDLNCAGRLKEAAWPLNVSPQFYVLAWLVSILCQRTGFT